MILMAFLQVGTDDDGYAVRLQLQHYIHYLQHPEHQLDDSPLYIFDGTFGDRQASMALMNDYSIPEYFNEDLFKHVGEKRRPPHRWFVLGPKRSGRYQLF